MDPLFGREAELAKLAYALEEARLGTGRVVLLSGEPGIGKSRLADEIARRARAEGFEVAWGRAWEAEGTPAYWPWIEALRALGASARLDGAFAAARADAPELDALLGGDAAPRGVDSASARFQLSAAVARLVHTTSAQAPLLVVLDDLHVADAASLALTAFIARGLRGARVLCVATTRDASFASDEGAALLAKLARDATEIPSRGLAKDAVARWIADAAPTLADDLDRLKKGKDGRPLDDFMPTEVLRNMDETERRALWAYLQSLPPVPFGQR